MPDLVRDTVAYFIPDWVARLLAYWQAQALARASMQRYTIPNDPDRHWW